MTSTTLARVALFVLLAAPGLAAAQERGRTDGPEGSEVGKGGYVRPNGGRFSLQLDWGASLKDYRPLGGAPVGPPLFVGLTASLWADEWFVLDASAAYLADSGRILALIGPRFRTGFWPVSLYAGVRAGLIQSPAVGARFGLSPSVGADLTLANHVLLGLNYSLDWPVAGDGLGHRIFMNVGYRF
jgi:hypothetical protein